MRKVALLAFVLVALAGFKAATPFTVHEWGTFTTVAGPDGQAQEWLPLGGPTDLPCFVQRYKNGLVKVLSYPNPLGPLLDYESARAGLKGTVRMETPVLYFYATRPTEARVSVRFPKGLFTEWYPKATVAQPAAWASTLKFGDTSAGLGWGRVLIRPGTRPELPATDEPSHYYAARDTDAAPVQVDGQNEKFLFYRGVGGFGVPISAALRDDRTLALRNLGTEVIPAVIVFTNRSGKIGYAISRGFDREADVALPALTSDMPALRRDLTTLLTSQGLYAKEAEAMVNTWRDTWFEEGTRVLYILPTRTVDEILPLTIAPTPDAISRVFVGRMDVVTPERVADVKLAIARNDRALLAKEGRLLSVIGERILQSTTDSAERAHIESLLKATFASYGEELTACD